MILIEVNVNKSLLTHLTFLFPLERHSNVLISTSLTWYLWSKFNSVPGVFYNLNIYLRVTLSVSFHIPLDKRSRFDLSID